MYRPVPAVTSSYRDRVLTDTPPTTFTAVTYKL
jgi:hypothetical protein